MHVFAFVTWISTTAIFLALLISGKGYIYSAACLVGSLGIIS